MKEKRTRGRNKHSSTVIAACITALASIIVAVIPLLSPNESSLQKSNVQHAVNIYVRQDDVTTGYRNQSSRASGALEFRQVEESPLLPKDTNYMNEVGSEEKNITTGLTSMKPSSVEAEATREDNQLLITESSTREPILGGPQKGRYQYVFFGEYAQGANDEIEPILWRVFSTSRDYLHLLSEKVLFYRQLNDEIKRYNKWNETELMKYLNSTFISDAFSVEAQELLVEQTSGRVLLLSANESQDTSMFPNSASLAAQETNYASSFKIKEIHRASWWLMPAEQDSRGDEPAIWQSSKLRSGSSYQDAMGIRPVCILDYSKVCIIDGSGALNDPFVLVNKSCE